MSNPDESLWNAVILQAISDCHIRGRGNEQRCARAEAHRWFQDRNADFHMVCDLAGRDPDTVYENYRKTFRLEVIRAREQKYTPPVRRKIEETV